MAKKFITDNEFYCTQCGRRGIPVVRKVGAERESGHLKKLFCLTCREETNHVECRPWTGYTKNDFLIEFEYGNFTEEGQRKMPYGELRSKINEGKVEKVKTILDERSSWLRKEHLDSES